MSDASSVLDTIGALRGLFNDVEGNRDQCHYLINRCVALEKPIEAILTNEPRLRSCKEAIKALKGVLDDCLKFCKKYAGKQWVVKAFRQGYKDDAGRFAELNARLTASSSDLQVAICADTMSDNPQNPNNEGLTTELQVLKLHMSELTSMLGGLLRERAAGTTDSKNTVAAICPGGVVLKTGQEFNGLAESAVVPERAANPPADEKRLSRTPVELVNITFDQLEWVEDGSSLLGLGAFAQVHRGMYWGKPCAVKTFKHLPSQRMTEQDEGRILREARVLQLVSSHRNVVNFHGVSVSRGILLLELGGCTLSDLLYRAVDTTSAFGWDNATALTEKHSMPFKLSLMLDVADALKFLHEHGVLHRDLKTSNIILVRRAGGGDDAAAPVIAKLSDFGLASAAELGQVAPSTASTTTSTASANAARENPATRDSSVGTSGIGVGTASYMAPELFDFDEDPPYSAASDMFAFGIVCNELLTEELPWPGLKEVQILHQVVTRKARPHRWEGVTPVGQHIMESVVGDSHTACLHQDPAHRPTAASVHSDISATLAQLMSNVGSESTKHVAFSQAAPVVTDQPVVCERAEPAPKFQTDIQVRLPSYDALSPRTDKEVISPRSNGDLKTFAFSHSTDEIKPFVSPRSDGDVMPFVSPCSSGSEDEGSTVSPRSAEGVGPPPPKPAKRGKPSKPPKPSAHHHAAEVCAAVMPLLEQLSKAGPGRDEALQDLSFLVQRNPDAQNCVLDFHGIPRLLSVMHEGTGEQACLAVTVLGNLAEGNPRLQNNICASGVLSEFRTVLVQTGNSITQECTTAAVMYTIIGNKEAQKAAVAAGVLAAVVPVIAHSKNHSEEGTLEDLRFMLSVAQEHTDYTALVVLFQHGPFEIQLQVSAFVVPLLKSAEAQQHKDAFGKSDAIEVLVGMLPGASLNLKIEILKLLKALTHRHDGNCDKIVTHGGVTDLAAVLTKPMLELRLPALQMLHSIAARGPSHRAAVLEMKVVPLLLSIHDSGKESPHVKAQADLLLTELGYKMK
jgi:serine/threonine protein kinase